MASLLRQRAKPIIRALTKIGMPFAFSSDPTRYDGMKPKTYGGQAMLSAFSIGDIVTLKGRSSHIGYVTEVIPTRTMKGEIPTVIVEWFGSNTTIRKATASWHNEDELIKVVPTSEGT
jgi:hypothetical protein